MIANDANYWTLEFKSDLGRIKNSMQLYLFFFFLQIDIDPILFDEFPQLPPRHPRMFHENRKLWVSTFFIWN